MRSKGYGIVIVVMMAFGLSQCQFQQPVRTGERSNWSRQSAPSVKWSGLQTVGASERGEGGLTVEEFRHKPVLSLGLGKVGVWVQPNSVESPFLYRFGQWFVADWRVAKEVSEKAGDKQVLIAFGAKYLDKVDDLEWQRIRKIRGVVLDYETGHTPEQAERELVKIYRYLHGRGYLVGVSTLARPASSLKTNGVDFRRANLYCDFLLPQLYSQIWSNDPYETRKRYGEEVQKSSVPVIPVVACATTKNNPSQLTPENVVKNYRPLELPSVLVWNVRQADLKFWEAVSSL